MQVEWSPHLIISKVVSINKQLDIKKLLAMQFLP